jgi:hypothetical protein
VLPDRNEPSLPPLDILHRIPRTPARQGYCGSKCIPASSAPRFTLPPGALSRSPPYFPELTWRDITFEEENKRDSLQLVGSCYLWTISLAGRGWIAVRVGESFLTRLPPLPIAGQEKLQGVFRCRLIGERRDMVWLRVLCCGECEFSGGALNGERLFQPEAGLPRRRRQWAGSTTSIRVSIARDSRRPTLSPENSTVAPLQARQSLFHAQPARLLGVSSPSGSRRACHLAP